MISSLLVLKLGLNSFGPERKSHFMQLNFPQLEIKFFWCYEKILIFKAHLFGPFIDSHEILW